MTEIEKKDVIDSVKKAIENKSIDNKYDDILKRVNFMAGLYDHTKEECETLASEIEESQKDREEAIIEMMSKTGETWIDTLENRSRKFEDSYREYLEYDEDFDKYVVNGIFRETEEILDKMAPLNKEGNILKKGLVIGNVQSGKTANYLALINKAADVGYKLIILMTGVHNILRKQTQERVYKGFTGTWKEEGKEDKTVGVGRYGEINKVISLTKLENDFQIDTQEQRDWHKENTSPHIMVIKKNVYTLNRVLKWLETNKELCTEAYPMLMIDDEADNASIDTTKQLVTDGLITDENKKDIDPTATNGLIRNILDKFTKRSYVGYTATPFANVFIDPDKDTDNHGEDLFPEDCIISIKSPDIYVGPKKVFLTNDSMLEKIEDLADGKCKDEESGTLCLAMQKGYIIDYMPESFYEAFRKWILTIGIRKIIALTKSQEKHNTFLVNISHLVDIQKQVEKITTEYKNELLNTIELNINQNEGNMYHKGNELMGSLWSEYRSFKLPNSSFSHFIEVLKQILKYKEYIKTFLVNSDGDKINYDHKDYEESGLNAIAIGGYSLSRGFTLIGLTTTYLVRNSANTDTLLQMGRWFGYRKNYEELCRIYMPEQMKTYYKQISETIEELKKDLKVMSQRGATPRQFSLRVLEWEGRLRITAANRMQNAEKYTGETINYSGSIIESIHLANNENTIKSNLKLVEDFTKKLSEQTMHEKDSKKNIIWKDISTDDILAFLKDFQVLYYPGSIKNQMLSVIPIQEYLERNKIKEFDVSFTTIQSSPSGSHPFENNININIKEKSALVDSEHIQIGGASTSLLKPQEEEIGIDKNLLDKLLLRNARKLRTKPMLFLHLLKIEDIEPRTDEDEDKFPEKLSCIPAYSIAFNINNNENNDVNKVYWGNEILEDEINKQRD